MESTFRATGDFFFGKGLSRFMETKCINLLVFSSPEFLKYSKVMVFSLRQNISPTIPLHIYYVSSKKLNLKSIEKLCRTGDSVVQMDIPTSLLFDGGGISLFPKGIFFRLLAPYFLPPDTDRLLFLDVDTIVDGDILPFYGIDFPSPMILAGEAEQASAQKGLCELVGVDYGNYVNGGVIVLDVEKYKTAYTLQEMSELIKTFGPKSPNVDQDVLNRAFKGRIVVFSEGRYNFKYGGRVNKSSCARVVIYHFYGQVRKPWDPFYGHLNNSSRIFWKYAFKCLNPFWCLGVSAVQILLTPLVYFRRKLKK